LAPKPRQKPPEERGKKKTDLRGPKIKKKKLRKRAHGKTALDDGSTCLQSEVPGGKIDENRCKGNPGQHSGGCGLKKREGAKQQNPFGK